MPVLAGQGLKAREAVVENLAEILIPRNLMARADEPQSVGAMGGGEFKELT
jgi:hypothetical protein